MHYSHFFKSAVVCLCLSVFFHSFADNSLINGDFEQGNIGWITWGGQISGQLQYKGTSGAGVYSSEHKWNGLSQSVKIPKNSRTFKVSGMMKTDEVVSGKETWEKANICVEFYDETDSTLSEYPPNVAEITGTTPWTEYSHTYSVNFLASAVNITLALGNATGSVQFDNISLEFFDEKGKALSVSDFEHKTHPLLKKHTEAKNKIGNGDFSDGFSQWEASETMIENSGPDGSSCLKLGEIRDENWAVQVIPLPKNVDRIVITGMIATDNVALGAEFWQCANIGAELLNSDGIRIGEYLNPIGNVSGTKDWNSYSGIFRTREGAKSIKVVCGMNGEDGIVLFDNIKVTMFDKAGDEI